MPLLGAHMSVSGGLEKALFRGRACGCQVIQVFTRNPSQWVSRKLSMKEIEAFQAARAETSIAPVAAHDSYLINLASPCLEHRRRSMKALEDELVRADLLGIPFLVIHPGAHRGIGEQRGLQYIAQSLHRVLDHTGGLQVQILLETTAGQGTSLGYRLEHLSEMIARTGSEDRLGVCLDTCHLFAAGYHFEDRESFNRMIEEFDAVVGLNRLKLIHVNDSKKERGSKIDRHEHIGQGCIGEQAFSLFLKAPALEGIPFILETPKGRDASGQDMDIRNLSVLKRLTEE